jgi:hypothetical protein
VWALTLIAAIIGAAVMFGVGFVVGDSGHDGGRDDAAGQVEGRGGFGAPGHQGRGGFSAPGQQGQGGLGGQGQQGRGGFGGQGQFPGGAGGGTQQLPIPGGGSGSGSGQGQVPSTPSTSGAFLGVATQQGTGGVSITQVAAGSAAEKAGLQVGDVITAFNGRSITTPTALASAVANLQPGDKVSIEVDRNGTTDTISVTLGSRSTANSN